ncbi:MAG: phosphoribosylglycinamide formyltransferase [Aerococcaceae bacterium]|nr:phosphoribosylglycinamide formyltransferase [Aerococcaceae bacterium]
MKLALFASGNGSNVQAILEAVKIGMLQAEIVGLVCDNPAAFVIERAQNAGIETFVLSPKQCANKQAWEEQVVTFLQEKGTELVVLAGFMRIVGPTLLEAFPQRITNIHPSLLPNFPGKSGIQDAFDAKVSQTGVTIHWVDAGVDTGPIIRQETLNIDPNWTLEQLETRIHAIEHRLYPETLQQIIETFNKGVDS